MEDKKCFYCGMKVCYGKNSITGGKSLLIHLVFIQKLICYLFQKLCKTIVRSMFQNQKIYF